MTPKVGGCPSRGHAGSNRETREIQFLLGHGVAGLRIVERRGMIVDIRGINKYAQAH